MDEGHSFLQRETVSVVCKPIFLTDILKNSPKPRCPEDWMCRGVKKTRENCLPPDAWVGDREH